MKCLLKGWHRVFTVSKISYGMSFEHFAIYISIHF